MMAMTARIWSSRYLREPSPHSTGLWGEVGAWAHTSRRGFKAMRRERLAIVPTHEATRKARWSEVKLTFDQSDHPPVLARGGKLTLVVSLTIHNVRMKRVLVDGGAA